MMNEGVPTTPNPGDKAKQDALFEDREPKKIIRVITVMAYMCSVSFVGVVLSAYYIFLWHPPNPRLMHQQVAHYDAQVDYLQAVDPKLNLLLDSLVHVNPEAEKLKIRREIVKKNNAILSADPSPDLTRVKAVEPKLNLLLDSLVHANPGAETPKIRREAGEKNNAIFSANFEKVKFTETSSTTEAANEFKLNNNIDTISSTFASTKATEDTSTTSETFSSVSPEENDKLSSEASEDSISNDKTITTTTASTQTSTQISPSSRRTKRPGIKKPHQTPFALKHLEVPIKLEPTRRRPIRFSTTTMKSEYSSSVPDSTEGTLSDNLASTSVTASSPDSSEVYENVASPRHVAKSLYKMLTNPPASTSLRDIDYSSSTDLPQIFPAVQRANSNDNNNNNDNDDYHDNDATITPMDEPNDD